MEALDVENVVIFVGDAVRFDAAVDQLSNLGPTCKSITASLHTPASFGSILTGLHVPKHGITGFQKILPPRTDSIFDIIEENTAFSNKTGTMHGELHRIFQKPDKSSLENMPTPFVWVVRDPGGHAPYDGYDPKTYEQEQETGVDYLQRVAGEQEILNREYTDAVESSISRFERAIKTIEDRGIADETLLIYLSDHGELLGEYGLLGHNHVACPELIYVPTTFVHPDLDAGTVDQGFRHVDLVPTVLELLGYEPSGNYDGTSLLSEEDRRGYNHFEMVFYNSSILSGFSSKVRSYWDQDGGHVFVDSNYRDAMSIYLGLLALSHNGKQILKTGNLTTSMKKILPGHETYGSPAFDRSAAESLIDAIEEGSNSATNADLDPKTKDRLADLGYL